LYTPFRIHDVQIEHESPRIVLHLLNRQEYQTISDHVNQHLRGTPVAKEKLLERGRYWVAQKKIDKAVNYYKKLFTILLSEEKKYIHCINTELQGLYAEEQESCMDLHTTFLHYMIRFFLFRNTSSSSPAQ